MIDQIKKLKLQWVIIGLVFGIISTTISILMHKSSRYSNNIERNCKDSIIVKHDTVYVAPEAEDKPAKPIPSLTKYKVSDIVCAWGKWSGVVNDIDWSSNDPNVLKYKIQIYKEGTDEDEGWTEEWYFDTELTLGKCH